MGQSSFTRQKTNGWHFGGSIQFKWKNVKTSQIWWSPPETLSWDNWLRRGKLQMCTTGGTNAVSRRCTRNGSWLQIFWCIWFCQWFQSNWKFKRTCRNIVIKNTWWNCHKKSYANGTLRLWSIFSSHGGGMSQIFIGYKFGHMDWWHHSLRKNSCGIHQSFGTNVGFVGSQRLEIESKKIPLVSDWNQMVWTNHFCRWCETWPCPNASFEWHALSG